MLQLLNTLRLQNHDLTPKKKERERLIYVFTNKVLCMGIILNML